MTDVPYIEARDDGWHLVDGESDSLFDSRQEAFDAVRDTAWFAASLERKAEVSGLAEPRWFDAAAVEPAPSAYDGSQVTANGIDQMVRNLALWETAVQMDGGGVSAVHASALDTDAPAAGWVYFGVKAIHADGRAHLWLYGAVLPAVDEQIEAKQLQFGSIAFYENDKDRYTSEDIGARLVSYALTNQPFIGGLTPHARSLNSAGHSRLAITRSQRIDNMTTKKKTPAERGPAKDLLTQVAGLLKIDLPADMSEEAVYQMSDRLRALIQAAIGESLTDGSAPAAPEGDATKAVQPDAAPAARALLPGFDSEEAQDAWTQDVRMALGEIFGQPDAAPAELLDLLKASTEAFKGAIGQAAPPDDGTSSENPDAVKSMRTEVANLRSAIDKQGAELKSLRSEKLDREIADEIAAVSAKAQKLAPAGEELAELRHIAREVADAGLDWKRHVRSLCANRAAPPVGTVTDPTDGPSVPGANATNLTEAIESAKQRVRSDAKVRGEKLTSTQIGKRAYDLAVAENPHLVKQSFNAASGGE